MYLLLILLPLLGSLFAGFFARYLGGRGGMIFTATCTCLSFIYSGLIFYEVALCGSTCSLEIMPWFFSEMFDSSWGLYFDTLTAVMLVVITSVSSLVKIYSISYMSEDPGIPRFMSYLSIFTFFMLMLVTADNLLQMFFGWEGVGLASYLLINFWFTRQSANKASIKAMVYNRVGDFGLALGIMALFFVFKSVSFSVIFASAPFLVNAKLLFLNSSFNAHNTICVLLFIGAMGKSAQIGLHTWLPDAMEGPTPVSALIHAATMVTAGVFLVARCSPIFEYAPTALMIVSLVGGLTCFFAATTGIFQNDIKRVIAYSTCSQLGYMIFACGISNYSVGVFHLFNHAFFKALLFCSAGSVIHALSNQQDMRRMGGLIQLLPLTYAMMLIGSLSLAGFPFCTGFYSKDVILEVAYARYTANGVFVYWCGSICVLLTSYYSFRLIFYTFLMRSSSLQKHVERAHDAPILMSIPLILLSIASIFVGFLCKDMMIGIGTGFWGNSLFTLPTHSNIYESEHAPNLVKVLPFLLTLLGIFLALMRYGPQTATVGRFLERTAPVGMGLRGWGVADAHNATDAVQSSQSSRWGYQCKMSWIGSRVYNFFNKRWYFDKIYNDFIAEFGCRFGYQMSFKGLDKGFFEICGPQGICLILSLVARQARQLQSGMIYHYAIIMYMGLILFLTVASLSHYLSEFIDARVYFVLLLTFPFLVLSQTDFTKTRIKHN